MGGSQGLYREVTAQFFSSNYTCEKVGDLVLEKCPNWCCSSTWSDTSGGWEDRSCLPPLFLPLLPWHPIPKVCFAFGISVEIPKKVGNEGKRRQLFNWFVYALKKKKKKRTDAICFPLFCPHYPVWIWFGWCMCMCMKEGGSHRESFVHLLLPDSFKKIKATCDPTLSAKKDSRLGCSIPVLQLRQILRHSQISQDSVIWFFFYHFFKNRINWASSCDYNEI